MLKVDVGNRNISFDGCTHFLWRLLSDGTEESATDASDSTEEDLSKDTKEHDNLD